LPEPAWAPELIAAWLDGDDDRRILALVDGAATAPGVDELVGLAVATAGRFSVVVAGHRQADDLPGLELGPLAPADARRLLTTPLAALGYRFARPELVWRLLSAVHFQPGLVQLAADELVRSLRVRRAGGLPVVVTDADVDRVVAAPEVRERLAEQLRGTISLDGRGRVLALVIACHSLDDAFGSSYGAEELLEEARGWWPGGFEDADVVAVDALLEHLVGRGVLVRTSGRRRYAVRNPDAVTLLGSRDDLEFELHCSSGR
ncbi:MAG TPA: hypothetical protein VGD67_29250, partial [Pseudonocardiaceae bacterium]